MASNRGKGEAPGSHQPRAVDHSRPIPAESSLPWQESRESTPKASSLRATWVATLSSITACWARSRRPHARCLRYKPRRKRCLRRRRPGCHALRAAHRNRPYRGMHPRRLDSTSNSSYNKAGVLQRGRGVCARVDPDWCEPSLPVARAPSHSVTAAPAD